MSSKPQAPESENAGTPSRTSSLNARLKPNGAVVDWLLAKMRLQDLPVSKRVM
jgi:hypothetical protein